MSETMHGQPERPFQVATFAAAGASRTPRRGPRFDVSTDRWSVLAKRAGGRAISAAGAIGLTAALYGALFFFGDARRGGVNDATPSNAARSALETARQDIEAFRATHGKYPDSLQDLPGNPRRATASDRLFYYKKPGDDRYYFLSVELSEEPSSPGSDSGAGRTPSP